MFGVMFVTGWALVFLINDALLSQDWRRVALGVTLMCMYTFGVNVLFGKPGRTLK